MCNCVGVCESFVLCKSIVDEGKVISSRFWWMKFEDVSQILPFFSSVVLWDAHVSLKIGRKGRERTEIDRRFWLLTIFWFNYKADSSFDLRGKNPFRKDWCRIMHERWDETDQKNHNLINQSMSQTSQLRFNEHA